MEKKESGQDWCPWEGSIKEKRPTWADPGEPPCLLGNLLGQIEGLEKPRLYLWGVHVCWLADNQDRERLVAGLPHFPISGVHWAGLQIRAMAKHWISGRQTLGEDLILLSGDSSEGLGYSPGQTAELFVTACMAGAGPAVVDFVGACKGWCYRDAQGVLSLRWRAPG